MELLAVRPGGFYVDGTVGLGGHAAEILRRERARRPPARRSTATRRRWSRRASALRRVRRPRARFVHADYRELPGAARRRARRDGVLLDLGVSSRAARHAERGFSFRADGPLDMRMDRTAGPTAADVVNRAARARAGRPHLPLRRGARVAPHRARHRAGARSARTCAPPASWPRSCGAAAGRARRPGLDPATLTFQALRIHVNRELRRAGRRRCARSPHASPPGGRLAVIAFHSLEDREVKQTFRDLAREGFALLTKKPVRPARRGGGAQPPRAQRAPARPGERRHEARAEAAPRSRPGPAAQGHRQLAGGARGRPARQPRPVAAARAGGGAGGRPRALRLAATCELRQAAHGQRAACRASASGCSRRTASCAWRRRRWRTCGAWRRSPPASSACVTPPPEAVVVVERPRRRRPRRQAGARRPAARRARN